MLRYRARRRAHQADARAAARTRLLEPPVRLKRAIQYK